MSVIIKGMDLPRSCMDCPLCILGEMGYRVCFVSSNIDIKRYSDSYNRNENCPMEEVEL